MLNICDAVCTVQLKLDVQNKNKKSKCNEKEIENEEIRR